MVTFAQAQRESGGGLGAKDETGGAKDEIEESFSLLLWCD